MENKSNKPKVKVTHTLADGTTRDSMDGFFVAYNEKTEGFYKTLENLIIKRAEGK